MWTPEKGDILYCKKDYHPEAWGIDKHAAGKYKKDQLVGHVPIEFSGILYFLQESETKDEKIAVNGTRR